MSSVAVGPASAPAAHGLRDANLRVSDTRQLAEAAARAGRDLRGHILSVLWLAGRLDHESLRRSLLPPGRSDVIDGYSGFLADLAHGLESGREVDARLVEVLIRWALEHGEADYDLTYDRPLIETRKAEENATTPIRVEPIVLEVPPAPQKRKRSRGNGKAKTTPTTGVRTSGERGGKG